MSGSTLLGNTSSLDKRDDALLVIVLIGFTLFFRLYMLQMINVGPDEIDYWFSARRLIEGGGYPEIMHRTIRWSIILPTAFLQLIFGTHPLVYYLPAVLNSLIQTVLLYYFGKKLFGPWTAFYAVLLFTAWPYMWRTGSQIRPAIFSITYTMVALYGLFLFLQTERRRYFFLSVVFLFLAYQSKITNLYFLPGILIILWLYQRRLKEPFFYGVSLFIMYLVEHISYWIFTGNKLGRLGIIANHHLTGNFAEELPNGFLGLFARYTDYMEFPWKVLFIAFIAATVYLLIKKKSLVRELTILHLSFFLFLTFMVKSIDPIQPVEPFLDRYYIVNLPTMSLLIIYALRTLFAEKTVRFFYQKNTAIVMSGMLVVLMLILTALPLPSAARRFYTPLTELSEHPIPKTFYFVSTMDEALEKKVPIISIDTGKPIDTANRVFYTDRKKGRTIRPVHSLELGVHTVYVMEGVGSSLDVNNPQQEVLWCDRFNFDMRILKLEEISILADVY